MAVNDHLQWVDFKDMTKGLHTADSSFLMPPESFQVMEDCFPRPEGGVRAFFKPTTTQLTMSGIGDATNERVISLSGGVQSTGISYNMVTRNQTNGQLKGYYWGVGATSWTLKKSFTAHTNGPANGGLAETIQYHDNVNGRNIWVVGITHAKDDGSEDGWWEVRFDTGVWTRINAQIFTGVGLVQYQARIVGVLLNTIVWTDPGSTVQPDSDNYLTIQTGHNDVRDIITNLVPYSPTSLLVSTIGSGWWVVDGDITDPVVREMGKDFLADNNQKCAITENGIVFTEANTGTFMTQNMAAGFQRIDPGLTPWTFDSQQGFGYLNGFLFAPTGRVYDTATGAWFTISDAATSYSAYEQPVVSVNGVSVNKAVIIPQFKANASMLAYRLDEASASRAESMRIKTAPLQTGNGRQVCVREVEVSVKSYHANSTVAVTVDGVTQTSNAIPVGTNVVRFPFKSRGEYVDVQVATASNQSGYEAPTIEEFRVGVRNDGHRVRLL